MLQQRIEQLERLIGGDKPETAQPLTVDYSQSQYDGEKREAMLRNSQLGRG